MAQATYPARALVLRKTKLNESDLICTLLLEDGSQARAVAKGARKPTSSFAARLELYSEVDLLLARGRNLDIVKEVRLVQANERIRVDLEHASGAAPMAELLDRVTQLSLEDRQLFPLTVAAFECLGRSEAAHIPAITAAHLIKVLAFVGLRPSFDCCVCCGRSLVDELQTAAHNANEIRVPFSYREGGVVCDSCATQVETVFEQARAIAWCRALLGSTFYEIEEIKPDSAAGFAALRFCQQWIHEHVGSNLKSLNFMFTCGLF